MYKYKAGLFPSSCDHSLMAQNCGIHCLRKQERHIKNKTKQNKNYNNNNNNNQQKKKKNQKKKQNKKKKNNNNNNKQKQKKKTFLCLLLTKLTKLYKGLKNK